jgi:glycosyltransferase involved in cell wall biosynthesis
VSVVVPAYQEEASIVPALERLIGVLEGERRTFEVVVVSDGSTDRTVELAKGLGHPCVRVVEDTPNRGKGHALRAGFAETRFPLVAFVDGDLDLDPVVLPSYLATIEADRADVVVGSKVHPDSTVEYPLFRRIASKGFKIATRMMIGLDLGDTQTGMKAMRRAAVAPSIEKCTARGFAFDLELLARLVDHDVRVVEAPVVLEYEFTSTVGLGSVFEAFRDLVAVARRRHALGRHHRGDQR